ncbi:MAG TPA: metallophosphoesterase family protein [Thermodesulfovibrionales bacterium]|nr:metallophosphoesterase family protein [Thermodesulfovibrionales bacterium]
MPGKAHHIGIISDTHGLVRPEAMIALAGSDIIIHAGDIGSPDVLRTLSAIAPVVAVRGNTDRDRWAARLSVTETVQIENMLLYIIHDLSCLDLDPGAAGIRAIISGHSHMPSIGEKNGVLHLNPGSAGPRRFDLPVTLAHMTVRQGTLQQEIIYLM